MPPLREGTTIVMLKQTLSFVLAVLLLQTAFAVPAAAKSTEEKALRRAAAVKAGIAKLGTGESALVEVKLRDKTKLKGYVREAGEDSFVLVNAKTGVATALPYPQVGQVRGHNLSTGAKIAIGLGITAAVLLFLALLIDE